MDEKKKRLLRWVFGTVLSSIIASVGACLLVELAIAMAGRGPSALVVQVDGPWEQVRITSENIESPLVFDPSAIQIQAEQILHGMYKIAIRYRDQKTLWLECFHADAGMAKTINVTVKREASSNTAAVEATCTYRGRQPIIDFSADVVIDETSEKTPRDVLSGP